MEGLTNYISSDLVLIHMKASDEFECIDQLGKLLFQKGFVKDTYIQAVKEREKIYPTGLLTSSVGVAIPHTDALHVNAPAVAIGTLEKPVEFHLMGDYEQMVPVQLIFQLAINEPSEQLDMLQNLVALFSAESLLEKLQQTVSSSQIIDLIKSAVDAF